MNTIERSLIGAAVAPIAYGAVKQGLQQVHNDVHAGVQAVGQRVTATTDAISNEVSSVKNAVSGLGHIIDTVV